MRKMCYDLETNTRKITPNIFEYINNSNIYYQQKICVMSYIELTLLIFLYPPDDI